MSGLDTGDVSRGLGRSEGSADSGVSPDDRLSSRTVGHWKNKAERILTKCPEPRPIHDRFAKLLESDKRFLSRVYSKSKRFPEGYDSFAKIFNAENPESPIPENFTMLQTAFGVSQYGIGEVISIIRTVIRQRLDEKLAAAQAAKKASERTFQELDRAEALRKIELRKSFLKTEFLIARKSFQFHVDQCVNYSNPLPEHNRHYEGACLDAEKLLTLLHSEILNAEGKPVRFFSMEEQSFYLEEISSALRYVFLEFTDTEEKEVKKEEKPAKSTNGDTKAETPPKVETPPKSEKPSKPEEASKLEDPRATTRSIASGLKTWERVLDREFPGLGREFPDSKGDKTLRGTLIHIAEFGNSFWGELKRALVIVNSVLRDEGTQALPTTSQ